MHKKYQIAQVTNNSDGSISFIRTMSLVDDQNETIELAAKDANWATTIYPHEHVDLVKELSRDGAILDKGCIDTIKKIYEPGIKAAWTPEVIQKYFDSTSI